MSRTWNHLKVGLFVLGGVALLVAGMATFGLRNEFRSMAKFETYVVGSVEGLSVGSPVKLKGVRVGEVSDIAFSWVEYPGGTPPAVVIRFTVAPRVLPEAAGDGVREGVRQGLRAMVATQGITGVSALSLDVVDDPSWNPPLEYTWTPRHPVVPSAPSQLSQILASAEQALRQLERLDVEQLQASLERTLGAASQALEQLQRLEPDRLGRELGAAATAATAAARDVRGLARQARRTLGGMELEALAREADRTLAGLRASSERIERLADGLAAVDVREVNATLSSARHAAKGLQAATEQLRRYPSGFLFGKEPPPASAVAVER